MVVHMKNNMVTNDTQILTIKQIRNRWQVTSSSNSACSAPTKRDVSGNVSTHPIGCQQSYSYYWALSQQGHTVFGAHRGSSLTDRPTRVLMRAHRIYSEVLVMRMLKETLEVKWKKIIIIIKKKIKKLQILTNYVPTERGRNFLSNDEVHHEQFVKIGSEMAEIL